MYPNIDPGTYEARLGYLCYAVSLIGRQFVKESVSLSTDNSTKTFHNKSRADMHLTHYKTSSSAESDISFPLLESWNPLTKVATIAAQVDKRRVLCRISMEVLQKKFHASMNEPMRAVAENRSLLQARARILIENNAFEEDGSIIIRSKDI